MKQGGTRAERSKSDPIGTTNHLIQYFRLPAGSRLWLTVSVNVLPRFTSALCIVLAVIPRLVADPPEDRNAWTGAPHGWHLDQLGPKTTEVAADKAPLAGARRLHQRDERTDGQS